MCLSKIEIDPVSESLRCLDIQFDATACRSPQTLGLCQNDLQSLFAVGWVDGSAAPAGAIEISVGNTRVRIEGSPDEGTLLLVLRMLRSASGSAA
jgi:hypothetical protein